MAGKRPVPGKDEMIQVRCNHMEKKAIKIKASQAGLTVADWVRTTSLLTEPETITTILKNRKIKVG